MEAVEVQTKDSGQTVTGIFETGFATKTLLWKLGPTFPLMYAQRFATFYMAHCKGNVLMYLVSASVIVLCRSILPHYAKCHHLFLPNNANRTSRKTLSKVPADVARVSDIDN
jgi:hypothetical protein